MAAYRGTVGAALLWAPLALGSGGCATFAKGALTELQAGWESAQQRATLAEARAEALAEEIDELKALLAQKGLTDVSGQSLSEVGDAVARQQAQVEEVAFDHQELRREVGRFQEQADRRQVYDELRLDRVESLLGLDALPAPDGTGVAEPRPAADTTTTVAPGLREEVPADPAGRLAMAEERMASGQQVAARVILEQTVAMVGSDDPMLPELQYRIAETWFNEGRYKDAARAFQAVADKHPRSTWAPWATLRIGECFDAMGKPDNARLFYEAVTTRFPASDAALEARTRLDR